MILHQTKGLHKMMIAVKRRKKTGCTNDCSAGLYAFAILLRAFSSFPSRLIERRVFVA
jgi:hypothetical protein